ncbi:MAG: hypothetical protein V4622_06315 [Bacteroidota bacterium]
MKSIKLILGIAVVSMTLFSCKKGENDPFLSLSSRKARITGEWKMSAMEHTYSSANAGVSNGTTKITFDGTTKTTTFTNPAGIVSSGGTSIYSEELTFEKDGTFKHTSSSTSNNETFTETGSGNWAFVGKSKNADLKKKEAIVLNYTSSTDSDGYNESVSGTFQIYTTILIDQLKNKEIVFKYDETGSNTNGGSTNTNSSKGSMTFVKK